MRLCAFCGFRATPTYGASPTIKCKLDADGNLAGPRKRRSKAERDVIGEEHSSAKSEMHVNVIAEYHTVKGWRGWKYYPETWTSATEAERRDMVCGIAFFHLQFPCPQ